MYILVLHVINICDQDYILDTELYECCFLCFSEELKVIFFEFSALFQESCGFRQTAAQQLAP